MFLIQFYIQLDFIVEETFMFTKKEKQAIKIVKKINELVLLVNEDKNTTDYSILGYQDRVSLKSKLFAAKNKVIDSVRNAYDKHYIKILAAMGEHPNYIDLY